MDLVKFPGVDVVADIEALPFAAQSISRVESNAVLEPVSDARAAVDELLRVLKTWWIRALGGSILSPASPLTLGLQAVDERGTLQTAWSIRPCRRRCAQRSYGDLTHFFSRVPEIVKSEDLREGGFRRWLLWPLRYLDLLLLRRPDADVLANHIYALVQKPTSEKSAPDEIPR